MNLWGNYISQIQEFQNWYQENISEMTSMMWVHSIVYSYKDNGNRDYCIRGKCLEGLITIDENIKGDCRK